MADGPALDPQAALIHVMTLVAAADSDISSAEISRMAEMVGHLPVFNGFDASRTGEVADGCVELLRDEDGVDRALDQIAHALPARLVETAYVLACDVAAADGVARQEELHLLELLRHRLALDRLAGAAIERAARERYRHA